MTTRKLHNYALSIDTKIDDLQWPWTAVSTNYLRISRDSQIWEATTVKWMNSYCQRQKCTFQRLCTRTAVTRLPLRQLSFLIWSVKRRLSLSAAETVAFNAPSQCNATWSPPPPPPRTPFFPPSPGVSRKVSTPFKSVFCSHPPSV